MNKTNCQREVQEVQKEIDFKKNKYQVVFDTTMGKITLDLYPEIAPIHCMNIIGLAKVGYYDGIIFHRVIKGFMIQAGCPSGTGTGGPGYKIKAEFNDRPHVPGVLSMARTSDPNSGGGQFFLVTGDASFLDRQYTVFGKTADQASLDVVMNIGSVPTGAGDKPREAVTINKASVEVQPL